LLCREMVRRWRGGGTSLLLLGLALSIAEECVIQQTSLAPLPFPGANASYGRLWGVNWVYFLFMLGFESVWVVMVPVQVTELIFTEHRDRPWLRRKGMVAACATFVFGSFIAWYSWTQQALPKKLHMPRYHPPLLAILLALAAMGMLMVSAYLLRGFGGDGKRSERRWVVFPWVAGLVALAMGAAWFELIGLMFVPHPIRQVWVPMAVGTAWCLVAYALFYRWSIASGWSEVHRLAVVFGATLGCEGMPYLGAAGWPRVDLYGKMILDVLALVGFWLLAKRVLHRSRRQRVEIVKN
jgi:hypothetical protein